MLLFQIAVTLIPGIGDITGKKLIAYCGDVEAVFKEKKQHLMRIPGIRETLAGSIISHRNDALRRAEKEISFIEKYKIGSFFFTDDLYPHRLKNCVDSPMMLYHKGNTELNKSKIVSIVGTRSATEYGKECCKSIVEGLAESDVLIVSGLAHGIDACAHREALKNGLPTLGVLAHGLDRIYPAVHRNLAQKMIDKGGLITDYISETNPDRENFPKRNRIIAGLSDATIIIEAAKKGGALITADIANSYNRDVFAVPGKITDTFSEGCNHFIKTNKAALIQSAADIKYLMGWDTKKQKDTVVQRKLFVNLSPEEDAIVKLLEKNIQLSIDTICLELQTTTSHVAAALLNLEFEGIVKTLPGKMYSLV
ncbi:MAG TPA: DNA-processing protein DprA [Bacteroidales bacterium]|nr:DNA-processing protein DprA [Bacteroidales bacterium]